MKFEEFKLLYRNIYFLFFLCCRPFMMTLDDGKRVISIRTVRLDVTTSLPVIVCNITVHENMSYVMHANGKCLSSKKVTNSILLWLKYCSGIVLPSNLYDICITIHCSRL